MSKKPRKKKSSGKLQNKKATQRAPSFSPQQQTLYNLLERKIEIPIEAFQDKHLFIATPCYGGQILEPYFRSMMKLVLLCAQYNIRYTISTLANESLITRGRNTLVSFFMENKDATHLFFIDADIEFNPEDVLRMLAYDKPITVGAYPKKAINWDSIINAARADEAENSQTIEGHSSNYVVNFDFEKDEQGNKMPNIKIKDNLIRLLDGGTGFMCIRRDVIQTMFDKYPEFKYNNDLNIDAKFEPYMYALFDCIIDPNSRRYLSEDYTFCRRWQDMGGEIWLDPRVALNHSGHYTFRGNVRKIIGGADVKNSGELYKPGMDNRPIRLMPGGGEPQVANTEPQPPANQPVEMEQVTKKK